MNSSPSHPVIIGQVAGVFGVRGWVKVRSETQPRDNILNYSPWYIQQGDHWQPFELLTGQVHGKGLIAQLKGCGDRDQAAAMIGCAIAIEREQMPEPEPGEYYWSDLLGLAVVNLQQQPLGHIQQMLSTGAHDVMVIRSADREILVPFVQQHYVMEVDLKQRRMLIDWPWLDDDEPEPQNQE